MKQFKEILTEASKVDDVFTAVWDAIQYNDNYPFNVRKLGKNHLDISGSGVKFELYMKGGKVIIEPK